MISVKNTLRAVAVVGILLAAVPLHAEYLRIQLHVLGLDCDLCARGVSASIQRMAGVESVEVILKTGTLEIALVPGNSVKMSELRKRIRDNGFRATDAKVTAIGRFNGQKFEVVGPSESYDVRSDSKATDPVSITFDIH
jgi:cation transport ATPase